MSLDVTVVAQEYCHIDSIAVNGVVYLCNYNLPAGDSVHFQFNTNGTVAALTPEPEPPKAHWAKSRQRELEV